MSESAFTVWGGIFAAALLAVAALALLVSSGSGGRKSAPDCRALVEEARELEAIAAAAFTKALEAADTAARRSVELENAENHRDDCDRLQVGAAQALADALQRLSIEESTGSAREPVGEASRAAMVAYRQGVISVEQLQTLWQQIDGWDATHEEQSHELTRFRAEDVEARRRYDAAALLERSARQAYEIAQVAARALTDEAADAAGEAQQARIAAQKCLRKSGRRPSA
ncbi:MAG: hypothetical protein HOU81_16720 [Hamadaea sp.]|uniref:hypothetical protein n=1 Tax=Hamadaea sp. TaxID=2024425 RepID=UPI0017C5B1F7|nr:hypothetical protein [Hamadaea sp.]NUR72460.1 hypothetical protein [Hamadaea sp.]NUT22224.1 hypothetical protein [Hamadaea sp.]